MKPAAKLQKKCEKVALFSVPMVFDAGMQMQLRNVELHLEVPEGGFFGQFRFSPNCRYVLGLNDIRSFKHPMGTT